MGNHGRSYESYHFEMANTPYLHHFVEQLKNSLNNEVNWDLDVLTTEFFKPIIHWLIKSSCSLCHCHPTVLVEDLYAAGCMGLWTALKSFDGSKYCAEELRKNPLVMIAPLRKYLLLYMRAELHKTVCATIGSSKRSLRKIGYEQTVPAEKLNELTIAYKAQDPEAYKCSTAYFEQIQERQLFKQQLSREQREVWLLLEKDISAHEISKITGFSRYKVANILRSLAHKLKRS